MYFAFISIVIGALAGLFAHKAAGMMISVRIKDDQQNTLVTNKTGIAWVIFFALLFANVALIYKNNSLKGTEYMIWFTAFILIAAVDFVTKKIPNELLLLLLISKLIFIPLFGARWDYLADLLGFVVAIAIFIAPSYLHLGMIGMGDIKYAAVLGFLFGAKEFLQIILIMSLAIGIYALILYLRKAGNLKTKVPVGPFISLGAVVTAIYPMISNI